MCLSSHPHAHDYTSVQSWYTVMPALTFFFLYGNLDIGFSSQLHKLFKNFFIPLTYNLFSLNEGGGDIRARQVSREGL